MSVLSKKIKSISRIFVKKYILLQNYLRLELYNIRNQTYYIPIIVCYIKTKIML